MLKGLSPSSLLRTWVSLKPFYFWMLLCWLLAGCQGKVVTHPFATEAVWSLTGQTHP